MLNHFGVCRCLGLGFPHLMIFTQSPRRMGCTLWQVSVSLGAANQLVVVGGSYFSWKRIEPHMLGTDKVIYWFLLLLYLASIGCVSHKNWLMLSFYWMCLCPGWVEHMYTYLSRWGFSTFALWLRLISFLGFYCIMCLYHCCMSLIVYVAESTTTNTMLLIDKTF